MVSQHELETTLFMLERIISNVEKDIKSIVFWFSEDNGLLEEARSVNVFHQRMRKTLQSRILAIRKAE